MTNKFTATQEQVDATNDQAVENGYDLLDGWTAYELAVDIGTYDADLEQVPIEVLEPLCQSWLDRRRAGR